MGKRELVSAEETVKEYTILAACGALLSVGLDLILKTQLIRTKAFWIFWAVMAVLTTIINGYLTGRPIVMYGEEFFLNIRFITIPLEDYLFGFSLLTSNIVLWEYFKKREKSSD